MLNLELSAKGRTTQDLLDALEETVRLVREGYTQTNNSESLHFTVTGKEEPGEDEG